MNKYAIKLLLFLSLALNSFSASESTSTPASVAILNFSERGSGVKDAGPQVSELMFAHLAASENIWLVERSEIDAILAEHELNLSGAVNPGQAVKVGQLTGARIIITGSIFKVGKKTYLIGKVISTETSRVLGASVNGQKPTDELAADLAGKIDLLFKNKVDKLLPPPSEENFIKDLKQQVGKTEGKSVYVSIKEQHLSQKVIDPAAETEFQVICKNLGFTVTNERNKADYIITGEGFSEFAGRHRNLISVKARLEIKITDKEGNLLAVDRQTDIALDLAENIAGKSALQNGAKKLAARMLPKVTK